MAIFTTASNLRVLCLCDFLLMDGTFKSCPRFFTQLYTVFGYVKRHIHAACLRCPFQQGSVDVRVPFWSYYGSVQRCEPYNTLNPSTVITDFEKAAMNAVAAVFPNAQRRGCRFHLGQSWRRIQALGMSQDYKDKTSLISKWLVLFTHEARVCFYSMHDS